MDRADALLHLARAASPTRRRDMDASTRHGHDRRGRRPPARMTRENVRSRENVVRPTGRSRTARVAFARADIFSRARETGLTGRTGPPPRTTRCIRDPMTGCAFAVSFASGDDGVYALAPSPVRRMLQRGEYRSPDGVTG